MITNRDRLIQTAAVLFHHQGYASTGIEQVVSTSGVSRSNLYYYFKSKTDLAIAVVRHWIEVYDRDIVDPALQDETKPARDRLLDLYERAAATQHPAAGQTGCPLGRLGADLATSVPAVQRLLTEYFDRLRQRIAKLLHHSVDLREHDAAEKHAEVLVCLLEGGLLLSHIQQDPNQVRQPGHTLVDLVTHSR